MRSRMILNRVTETCDPIHDLTSATAVSWSSANAARLSCECWLCRPMFGRPSRRRNLVVAAFRRDLDAFTEIVLESRTRPVLRELG